MAISEDQWRKNLAAFMHETQTPWRAHDKDGACCRAAREDLAGVPRWSDLFGAEYPDAE